MKTKDVTEMLAKVPWFILLGVILILNVGLNTQALQVRIVNAISQVLLYFVVGYLLYEKSKKAQAGSFNAFLMTGVFVLSTLITWFSPSTQLLSISIWALFIAQVFLAGATALRYHPVKSLGTSSTWHYAVLLVIMILAIAGVWIHLIHLGYSQGLLWNMAVAILSFSYLMKKANTNMASFMQLASILIAVFAAFVGFTGLTLSVLP